MHSNRRSTPTLVAALILCVISVAVPAGACEECEPKLVTIEDGFGMLPADAVRQVIEDPPEVLPPDRRPSVAEPAGSGGSPVASTWPQADAVPSGDDPEGVTAPRRIRTSPSSGSATRHYI